MSNQVTIADNQFFQNLVDHDDDARPAPARLKARIYSALIRESQSESPLRDLSETRRAGYALCIWEKVMGTVPGAGKVNHCWYCPARVVAESLQNAPVAWAGCPYAQFHKR